MNILEQTSSGEKRLGSLDSIRGLACLAVLLGHTLAVFQWDIQFSRWLLLNNVFDGRSAVTMFFVLSGFVLTFSSFKGEGRSLLLVPFFARRFTRIWIPWFAFFVLSWITKEYFYFPPPETTPSITDHHASFWSSSGFTVEQVIKQMTFTLHDPHIMLLPQDWSLGVELRASILIPLFLVIARKNLFLMLVIGLSVSWLKPGTGYYYTSFSAGVAVAYIYSRHGSAFKSYAGYLLALGLVLYQIRWLCFIEMQSVVMASERFVWLVSSVGCSLIIFGVLNCQLVGRFLEHGALSYLGRVSYSLYLVQVAVLMCLAPHIMYVLNLMGVMNETMLQFAMLVVIAFISISLSHFGEKWIEVPSVQAGRQITSILKRLPWVGKIKI